MNTDKLRYKYKIINRMDRIYRIKTKEIYPAHPV
jgi:hypothetical protein